MILQVYIDEPTWLRLKKLSLEADQSEGELAERAIENAALDAFRHRGDDPARKGT